MRVIAGSRKGHRLSAPKGPQTRPTGDRVREALFNMLGPLDGASVLDLYAGSGALGIEALSRGASRCVFVDTDAAAARTIAANLERLRLTGARIERRDAVAFLRDEGARGRRHDLVLCDPPYEAWPAVEPRLARVLADALTADGMVAIETAAAVEPQLPLDPVTTRRYGSARITILRSP